MVLTNSNCWSSWLGFINFLEIVGVIVSCMMTMYWELFLAYGKNW